MRPTSRARLSPRRCRNCRPASVSSSIAANAVGKFAVREIKLRRHADIAQRRSAAARCRRRRAVRGRPSPPAPPQASSRDRPRRRCRCSCRARRSAKADARRRRQETRALANSARRRRCAASRCSRPAIPHRSGRPTARCSNAARSTLSGVCLPSLSSTIRRHRPLAGSITRILAHSPSRSMARKNTPGSLPQRANRSGARKNRCSGWPSTPSPLEPNAQGVADRAGGAVAADKVLRLDRLALAGVEIVQLGGHAAQPKLRQRIQAACDGASVTLGCACANARRIGSNQICEQICSRVGLCRLGLLLRSRRPPHARQFMAGKAGDKDHVERMIVRKRTIAHWHRRCPSAGRIPWCGY